MGWASGAESVEAEESFVLGREIFEIFEIFELLSWRETSGKGGGGPEIIEVFEKDFKRRKEFIVTNVEKVWPRSVIDSRSSFVTYMIGLFSFVCNEMKRQSFLLQF